ncbi:ABC transporter permease/substrate-binding protein [Polymorphobacter sp.]|uniref:ABC transporter permease/substrate-binding protein n=1 Tax=Polymorphobacter sp. TaxID=1909290 RepID=UPI003F721DBA
MSSVPGVMAGEWGRALAMVPERAAAHLGLSAAAVALAVVASVPLVLAMAARPRLRGPVLAVAGVIQTVPALALLALFYPFLLLVSGVSERLLGFGVPALGFLPSLLALALYALLPLLRGGADGLASVPAATLDAADGIGMTRGQRLRMVELPLAAPIIMGGLRVATVWTIGAATLATTIGQRSLGDLIFAGLQLQDWALVVTGCLAAAGLAIWVDLALGRVERGWAARRRGAVWLGVAGLAVLAALVLALPGMARPAAAAASGDAAGDGIVVVGAKNFGEQYVLAELIAARLRAQGMTVEVRSGLGSAIAFRALAAGDIDVYVDYSGTLWEGPPAPRDEMLARLRAELPEKHGVSVAAALGFENAYALAMKRGRARALGIRTLDDLARRAGKLRLATDIEFQSRPEWAALQRVYGLKFAGVQAFTPTLMVQALGGGSADVITAFSSDGRIAADDLVLLEDSKGALPAYDALLLVGPKRPWLAARLAGMEGMIDVAAMREANWMVDREADKRTPVEAAAWLTTRIEP